MSIRVNKIDMVIDGNTPYPSVKWGLGEYSCTKAFYSSSSLYIFIIIIK